MRVPSLQSRKTKTQCATGGLLVDNLMAMAPCSRTCPAAFGKTLASKALLLNGTGSEPASGCSKQLESLDFIQLLRDASQYTLRQVIGL